MLDRIDRAVCLGLMAAALLTTSAASAQRSARASHSDYPNKPVRVIVPLSPGGGSDIVGRIVAAALAEHWGQAVIVDNRPGAGTTIGTSIAAKAAPDAYTLLVSSSSIAISPALYKNLDFDITRDFAGVALIASQPSILAVHPSLPVNSLRELIALTNCLRWPKPASGVLSMRLGTDCWFRPGPPDR